ncbi:MAG: DUF58 domain-containing protein, partial [Allosphingosinicella sp.]
MILLAAAVAPFSLLAGIFYPLYWTSGLALIAFIVALAAADVLASATLRAEDMTCEGPRTAGVGETFSVIAQARFDGPLPTAIEIAVGMSGPVFAPFGWRSEAHTELDVASAAVPVQALRRGVARVENIWVRWHGRLGLAWRQRHLVIDQSILILPDIRPLREQSVQLLNREASHGIKAQLQVGEGAEFEALADYRQGMDRR